ncbi:MAG: ABC transporter permease [Microcella sp.]|uniref:ABC transporter permease n=1 Tax=Microcella sp. TaxID=1913979 RepID=UPI003315BDDB
MKFLRSFAARPEFGALVLLPIAFLSASLMSPFFFVGENLANGFVQYTELGLLALGLTFVIISGHIDLSVASILALSGVALGRSLQAGWPVEVAVLLTLAVGLSCGLVNAILVTRTGLTSLIVTLGTFALFGGIAQGLVGYSSIGELPESFVGVDRLLFVGIPLPIWIFAVCAIAAAVLLHGSVAGRKMVLTGMNAEAARYAEINTARVEYWVFALSGLMAGLAAVLLVSRSGVVVYNLASGYELTAITIVVVGGASIYGGSGSILGTVSALVLIATLQRGMSLAGIAAPLQLVVIGVLLIGSIAGQSIFRIVRTRVNSSRKSGSIPIDA